MKLTLFGSKNPPTNLLNLKLFNEDTFYPLFIKDLNVVKVRSSSVAPLWITSGGAMLAIVS
jgi:hypothetical protein